MNTNKLVIISFIFLLLSIGFYGAPLSANPDDLVRVAVPNAKKDPQIPSQYRIALPDGGLVLLMIHEESLTGNMHFEARFDGIPNREGAIAAAAHLLDTLGLWKLESDPRAVSLLSENSVTIDWVVTDELGAEATLNYLNQMVNYAIKKDLKQFAYEVILENDVGKKHLTDAHAWARQYLRQGRPMQAGAGDLVGYILLQQEPIFIKLGEVLGVPGMLPDWQVAGAVKKLLVDSSDQKKESFIHWTEEVIKYPALFRSPIIQNVIASLLGPLIDQGMMIEEASNVYRQWLSLPVDQEFAGSTILKAIVGRYPIEDNLFGDLLIEGFKSSSPQVRALLLRDVVKPLVDFKYPSTDKMLKVVEKYKDDPSLVVRLAVFEAMVPKATANNRAEMMQMMQSYFQNPSDRQMLLVRDPLYFYGFMATLFGMLSDSDNDDLFVEAWMNLAPLLATQESFPSTALYEISKDIGEAFSKSNEEGRASLAMLLQHISARLEDENPQAAQLWNQIVTNAIDIVRS